MSLMAFVKFGYTLVVVSLILMIWASIARALETHVDAGHPPCLFQAQCTCSKPHGDLGSVTCNNVAILKVPSKIANSKVFTLQLRGNEIRYLEPKIFQATGLYRLEISQNPLESIHDEAFFGLDNSLWELVLRQDKLTSVPSRALRYLTKLRLLNLAGNEIAEISGDNWRGHGLSLQTLILADNSITILPLDAFSGLPSLDTLDLSGNRLSVIDSGVFRDGMNRLNKLLLQDNLLSVIPYEEISPLRQLRYLDLSNNVIKAIPPTRDFNGVKLSLDTLKLDYNMISILHPGSFNYFDVLNTTSLDGNPIYALREDAFRNAKIKSLSLRDCSIVELSPAAFSGLENSLQTLDLSENNLTIFSTIMLQKLDALKSLNLRENKVDSLSTPLDYQYAPASFNNFQYRLVFLDMSGAASLEMNLQDVRRMRSLRYLSVGKLINRNLLAEDFLEYGVELEELKIIGSTIKRIESSAFQHVRTIKSLDLSENNLEFIDPNAFAELHSLTTLKLVNGLDESVRILPFEPLKAVIDLQYLDLSNNKLKNVPDTSFHFLYELKKLNLQDNAIEYFSKGTLQGDIHKKLETISLSHNQLRQVIQHTFVDLPELQTVLIEDNLVDVVQRRAFTSLDNLKVVRLRGNQIYGISDEAFQNLPALMELDISFNLLETFKFTMFDQVGSATSLKVNASYNQIYGLSDSVPPSYLSASFHAPPPPQHQQNLLISVNIGILDFSHNNITYIAPSYFRHVALTLTKLNLSHNRLRNLTYEVFGNLNNLQYLDISHNFIMDMEYDCFKRIENLQIINLSHNRLRDLPVELFRDKHFITSVDLSDNQLRNLADNFILSRGLERLDLSNNLLSTIPTNAMSTAAAENLVELDLSGNTIPSVSVTDFVQRFRNEDAPGHYFVEEPEYNDEYMYHTVRRDNPKVHHQKKQYPQHILYKSLARLDLSNNHLVRIDAGSFTGVPRLRWLDISNSSPFNSERGNGAFKGLERSLTYLGMRNVSLMSVPHLDLPYLRTLDLAYNNLPSIAPDSTANLTRLRSLDISYNDLSTVPVATHTLNRLRWLSISGNPFTALMNTSLFGVTPALEYLDVTRLRLRTLESGVFSRMFGLRTLKMNVYYRNRDLNIPRMLTTNVGLKNLLVDVEDDRVNLGNEMAGPLPSKLCNITFTGPPLQYLSEDILSGVYSKTLRLTIFNTSITEIEPSTFWNTGRISNLTLDFRQNHLIGVPNPSRKSWPGVPNNVFLHEILLSGNPLYCDCGIGWVEAWDRKRRQYLCKDPFTCVATRDDVRFSNCNNYENRSLNDVFIRDLDCYFGNSAHLSPKLFMIIGLLAATLIYI